MREVFGTIARWLREGVPCAAGTLVQTYRSAPAPLGTTVGVDANGRIAGNIGAGCHEADIVQSCLQTIRDGELRVLAIDLSSTDEIDGTPGCGGALKIAVWKPEKDFLAEALAIAQGLQSIHVRLPQGYSFTIPAKRQLVVVGATTLAQAVARIAQTLDFYVTVVDPRPAFATPERLPNADALVRKWPDEYLPNALESAAAVLVISHDPKFDLPALRAALRSSVPYIGLLGSRRSQNARRESLREFGFSDEQLQRIHGPVGLDLGGASPAETALSILAQILADANARSAMPLDRLTGAIHSSASAVSMST